MAVRSVRVGLGPTIVATIALVLAGCGGDSNNPTEDDASQADGSGSSSGSGNVALMMSDAPTDEFDEIHMTVTRVSLLPAEDSSDSEAVPIFEDAEGESLDLLQLRDYAELLSVQEDVPAGTYGKVRLESSGVRLVDSDSDPVVEVDATLEEGRLDLILDEPVEVSAERVLYLELDVVADESLLTESEDGEVFFQPFVTTSTFEESAPDDTDDGASGEEETADGEQTEEDAEDSPLISVRGFVREAEGSEALVCPARQASNAACVRFVLDEDMTVFDESGEALASDAVEVDARVLAMGRLERNEEGRRVLDVLSLGLGSRPAIGTRGGSIESVSEDGAITLTNGREVELFEGAGVVDGQGRDVDLANAEARGLTLFGLVRDEPLKAGLVVLRGSVDSEDGEETDSEATELSVVRGDFVALDTEDAIQVEVDGDIENVRLIEDGKLMITGKGRIESGSLEKLTEFEKVRIAAWGTQGDSYFEAEKMLAMTRGRNDVVRSGPPDHAGPPDFVGGSDDEDGADGEGDADGEEESDRKGPPQGRGRPEHAGPPF